MGITIERTEYTGGTSGGSFSDKLRRTLGIYLDEKL